MSTASYRICAYILLIFLATIYYNILQITILSFTKSEANKSGVNKTEGKTETKSNKWKKGSKGLVRWKPHCNFSGYSLGKLPRRSAEQCGSDCLAYTKCNHFTYAKGFCYIKSASQWVIPNHLNGAICGYIKSRITVLLVRV